MNKAAASPPCHIHVDGDVIVHHHIYLGCCRHPAEGGDGTRIIRQQGGDQAPPPA